MSYNPFKHSGQRTLNISSPSSSLGMRVLEAPASKIYHPSKWQDDKYYKIG